MNFAPNFNSEVDIRAINITLKVYLRAKLGILPKGNTWHLRIKLLITGVSPYIQELFNSIK